jgi:hypothetical protein
MKATKLREAEVSDIASVLSVIHPRMIPALRALRKAVDEHDSAEYVREHLVADNTNCAHAMLLQILSAYMLDKNVDEVASFLGTGRSVAFGLVTFLAMSTSADEGRLCPEEHAHA